jgi:hypothetical protein
MQDRRSTTLDYSSRLDQLPQRLEQLGAGPLVLALASRPQQPETQLAEQPLELAAAGVLVGEQDLPRPGRHQPRLDRQQVQQHLALISLGPGEGDRDWQAVQGADQVQPQPPEVTGAAGAIAVLAHPASWERLAVSRERPHSTGGGVHHPDVVAPQRRVRGHGSDEVAQPLGRAAQALVVAGLAGQIREQVA